MMTEDKDIEELKEKLKKGTISYFQLSKEEIFALEESLKNDIKKDKEIIKNIKSKIEDEKKRLNK